jgi:hypothetical protein
MDSTQKSWEKYKTGKKWRDKLGDGIEIRKFGPWKKRKTQGDLGKFVSVVKVGRCQKDLGEACRHKTDMSQR